MQARDLRGILLELKQEVPEEIIFYPNNPLKEKDKTENRIHSLGIR